MGQKRKTIGILYQPSKNWIAGSYYVQNIVAALKQYCTQSGNKLPLIVVFCDTKKDFDIFNSATEYPLLLCHLINRKPNRAKRLLQKAIKKVTCIQITKNEITKRTLKKLLFVYPIIDLQCIPDKKKILSWIPDFQEKYYPNFFSPEEKALRENWHRELISENIPIVFSSRDAQSDFIKFYPDAIKIPTFILPFSVKHPNYSQEKIDTILVKYGIKKKYLFCANQFWIHKNHMMLFKTMNILRSNGCDLQLVCSGALQDYRTNTYHSDIVNYIERNHLQNTIKILGFIDRTEQLCLMKNAYAIVQPSLFEGWSTVVEDAKRLNKFIFLSNLNVHREQCPTNACFFDPYNEQELATKIQETTITENSVNYLNNVYLSGKAFWEIINFFH